MHKSIQINRINNTASLEPTAIGIEITCIDFSMHYLQCVKKNCSTEMIGGKRKPFLC